MKNELQNTGFQIIDDFLSVEQSEHLLALINKYRTNNTVPEVVRENPQNKERSLHYWIIDGVQIETHLPEIWDLYCKINQLVNNSACKNLTNLENKKVTVNINIMKETCEYRWHYDRNAVTVVLYLTEVLGGNTEVYPNYRLHLGKYQHTALQNILDLLLQTNFMRWIFTKKHIIRPCQGRLLMMQGNKCLYSVSSVEEDKERINIIMAYDDPISQFPMEKNLDSYLYTQEISQQPNKDPNYS